MLDRQLVARYLRQRAELGERELFLEDSSARQLLALLARAGAAAPVAPECAAPSPAGTATWGHGDTATPANETSRAHPGSPGVLDAPARAALIREALGVAPSVAPAPRGKLETQEPAAPEVPRAPEPEAAAERLTPAQPEAASTPPPRVAASAGERQDASSALAVLAREAGACEACRLAATRTNVVFGEGSATAELVIVGEAPGQEEDRTGRPFVGQAGKLLDLLLMSAGFPRESVYICNTLKCRPPQNRNPLPEELASCATFLERQLATIRPRVLLAVGKFAGQTLAGSEDGISRLRGRVFRYRGIPLVVTYHPAYLLRSPQWTRTVWEDFQLARKVLDEQA